MPASLIYPTSLNSFSNIMNYPDQDKIVGITRDDYNIIVNILCNLTIILVPLSFLIKDQIEILSLNREKSNTLDYLSQYLDRYSRSERSTLLSELGSAEPIVSGVLASQ